MDWVLLGLRLLHIGSGVFWVGSAFTFFLFIAPSAQVLAPPHRSAFMNELVTTRRLSDAIAIAGVVTVLAGSVLYWRDSLGLNPVWITSPTGLGFTAGAAAAIAALLLGALVIGPTAKAMGRLGEELSAAGRPPTPEEGSRMAALADRLRVTGVINLVLLGTAVFFMAISRYLR